MSYNIDLSGRVAFVTGASGGLGEQFARTLSQAGAAVVLAARRIDRLKTLRAELEAEGGDAHVVTLDVTDPDSIKSAVAHAETEMGTIDILVNNSGVSTTQKLVDVSPDDYDYVMNTNTRGAFFVAQEVAKRMIARSRGAAPGTFTGGRIVNVASMAGLLNAPNMGAYNVSKHAVVSLSETLYQDLALVTEQVSASVLCPYFVPTGIHQSHRNRPEELRSDAQPTASQMIAQVMSSKAVTSGRLTATDVANLVFKGVEDRQFYLYTHPQALAMVQTRLEDVVQVRNPTDPFVGKPEIGEQLKKALREAAAR